MDNQKVRAIAFQLIKELGIAFTVAIIYSCVRFNNLPTFVEHFGSSFFFVAWITGSFVRVSKQKNQETNFDRLQRVSTDLIDRSNLLLEDLRTATSQIIGYTTGKGSYPALHPSYLDSNSFTPLLYSHGSFPIFDMKFTMALLNFPMPLPYLHQLYDDLISMGDIHPHFPKFHMVGQPLVPGEINQINVSFETRNGRYTQLTRLIEVDSKWEYALRILGANGRDLEGEQFSTNFPEDQKDSIFNVPSPNRGIFRKPV